MPQWLIAALLVAIGALSGAATGKPEAGGPKVPPPVTIQILNVSDWHGNLDPFGSSGSRWCLEHLGPLAAGSRGASDVDAHRR